MAQGADQVICIQARTYWALIAKRVSYARDLQKNFEVLQKRVEDLSAKTERDQERRQSWGKKVAAFRIKKEVESIKKDYDNEQENIKRMCPDYFARMRLGERVIKLSDKVKGILDEVDVGYLFQSLSNKTLEETEALCENVQKLITKIKEKKYPKIGIYGPHGVGKTTVMQLVKRYPEVTTDFDFVIWVTVSKSWTIKKLQNQVGQCLSMKITMYESDEKVAEKIFRVLLGKKYLLFLDDVRKMVDLGDLGFPNASTENECQVVLTTTPYNMCWEMGTGFDIKLEGFSSKDAGDMFNSLAGDMAASPFTKPSVTEITAISCGIPRSIKILAGILRNAKSLKLLDDFIFRLSFHPYDISASQEIYSASYDELENTKKVCLTCCISYPENHKIKKSRVRNFMRASMAELIIPGESLTKIHEKIDTIIDDLVKSAWLDECDGGGHVTMPVELRDLLLGQPSEMVLFELPANGQLGSYNIVSLLLKGNEQLRAIPESIFREMPNLQNVDLSGTSIKSLPDSIARLKNLHSLFLKDCYFLEAHGLPEKLGEVETLEFLQVSGAWMPHLPLWIFEVKSLKFLKFGYRSIARWWSAPYHMGIGEKKCEIPPGSVSKLSQIEVFNVSNFMYNSRLGSGSLSTIAKELGSLTQLYSLQFVFRTIGDLDQFIKDSTPWKLNDLQKFRFIVGEGKDFRIDVKKRKKYLKYIRGRESGKSILPEAVLEVLKKSSCFELEKHDEIESLSQLGEEATRGVSHCVIHGCANMTHVIKEGSSVHIFKNLESLTLSNLPKLESISSLDSLEEVCIVGCPLLTKLPLFSPKLKKIKGSRKWWEALIWVHEEDKSRCESLFVEA